MMLKSKALISVLILFTLISMTQVYAQDKKPAEDPIAIVNGVVIPRKSFDQEINAYQKQMDEIGMPLSPEDLSKRKQEVLNKLIDREVLYQESQKEGIKVKESQLDKMMAGLKNQFPEDKQYKEKMTQLQDALRPQLRQEVAVTALIWKKFKNRVAVSNQEVKKYYDEHPDDFRVPETVRISRILIKVDPNASAAEKAKARQKIEEVQKKLKEGEDFAALAVKYSEGPKSAEGGDLGYFDRGEIVGPVSDFAFSMKVGDVSDVVETQFGFELVKVTDKKPEGKASFEESKDKIKSHLKKEKLKQDVNDYTAQLRQKAKIETFLK